jgi:hypothetical protein
MGETMTTAAITTYAYGNRPSPNRTRIPQLNSWPTSQAFVRYLVVVGIGEGTSDKPV